MPDNATRKTLVEITHRNEPKPWRIVMLLPENLSQDEVFEHCLRHAKACFSWDKPVEKFEIIGPAFEPDEPTWLTPGATDFNPRTKRTRFRPEEPIRSLDDLLKKP